MVNYIEFIHSISFDRDGNAARELANPKNRVVTIEGFLALKEADVPKLIPELQSALNLLDEVAAYSLFSESEFDILYNSILLLQRDTLQEFAFQFNIRTGKMVFNSFDTRGEMLGTHSEERLKYQAEFLAPLTIEEKARQLVGLLMSNMLNRADELMEAEIADTGSVLQGDSFDEYLNDIPMSYTLTDEGGLRKVGMDEVMSILEKILIKTDLSYSHVTELLTTAVDAQKMGLTLLATSANSYSYEQAVWYKVRTIGAYYRLLSLCYMTEPVMQTKILEGYLGAQVLDDLHDSYEDLNVQINPIYALLTKSGKIAEELRWLDKRALLNLTRFNYEISSEIERVSAKYRQDLLDGCETTFGIRFS